VRRCFLADDLRYTDPNALVWLASKRDPNASDDVETGTTDGASIPKWAQSFVGLPFDPSYIKAAVIHDHYTYHENRVRSWVSSQRVFYDMLQDLGVPQSKAQIMYLGVLLGSSKWLRLVPGENCGDNCINDLTESTATVSRVDKIILREWPSIYHTEDYGRAMKSGIAAIAVMGDRMTADDLNALAAALLPDHPVLSRPDDYPVNGPQDTILSD
jgi:hypothetical protein